MEKIVSFISFFYMQKLTSKILLFLFVAQLLMPFFSVSSAQSQCESNPDVCSATPESMYLYLEFQREMAALLQTTSFQTATMTISQWEGVFTNKLLNLDSTKNIDDSLASQALKLFYITSARSATALVTSSFLFGLSALGTLWDNTIGLSILLKDRAIVRDRAKLLDIERNLNQTAYHLWQAGDITKTITETAPIRSLLKKYEEKGLLTQVAGFSSSVRYMDLLMTLASMNISVKAFLAYNVKGIMRDFKESGLKFNPEWIQKLDDDYRCVRWALWFKCNRSRKSLTNNLQILTNSTKEQGTKSWKVMKNSFDDLKKALGTRKSAGSNVIGKSSDEHLTEREKSLLRDVYGLDTTKMTKDEALSILSLSNQTKGTRKEIANAGITVYEKGIKPSAIAIRSLKDKETRNTIGRAIAQAFSKVFIPNKKSGAKVFPESSLIYSGESDVVWIKRQFDRSAIDILEEIKKENDLQYIENYPDSFTLVMIENLQILADSRRQIDSISSFSAGSVLYHQFWELSEKIKKLIKTVGNKDENLRQILNQVCSYQCNNKGTETCFIQYQKK